MNATNEPTPATPTAATTQKVAYWNTGLWTDPDTAAFAVEMGEFPDDYKIAEFPADAPPELIDTEITALLAA